MFVGFGLLYGLFILVPGSIFLGIVWVARKMYEADPWMIDVGIRHVKYAKYYAPSRTLAKNIPTYAISRTKEQVRFSGPALTPILK